MKGRAPTPKKGRDMINLHKSPSEVVVLKDNKKEEQPSQIEHLLSVYNLDPRPKKIKVLPLT